MRTHNQQYFHNLVSTMINQLPLEELMSAYDTEMCPQDLYKKFGENVRAKVLAMRPEIRGVIADFGIPYEVGPRGTPLYYVHCSTYLGKYQSGRDLLIEIAVTAIIAKMYDILRGHGYFVKHSVGTETEVGKEVVT